MLRAARAEDWQAVVDTVREVYDEYGFTWEAEGYHADLYDLSGYLDPAKAAFWVGEIDGEVVGCGGVKYFDRIPGPLGEITMLDDYERIGGCSCDIVRMYVRPSGRRRGIAGGIMELIIGDARSRGAAAIEIWSDKRFEDAHRLYQKFGAVVVGDRICHDPDQAPEWGLFLGLSPS